jgi:hypothetical protein
MQRRKLDELDLNLEVCIFLQIRPPEVGILPDIPGAAQLSDPHKVDSYQSALHQALVVQILAAYACYIFG